MIYKIGGFGIMLSVGSQQGRRPCTKTGTQGAIPGEWPQMRYRRDSAIPFVSYPGLSFGSLWNNALCDVEHFDSSLLS